MDPNHHPSQEHLPTSEDILHETVTMIVSGYLKNNLDKHNQPVHSHFAKGLERSLKSGIQLKNPKSRDAKVVAFLKYITQEDTKDHPLQQPHTSSQDASHKQPLQSLVHDIAEDFAIDISNEKKLDQLAEAVFDSEIAVLIKRGQGDDIASQGMSAWDILDEATKDRYRNDVKQKRDDQVQSLERWVSYVASDETVFPTWYKYFIITSLRSMGVEQFEFGTYTYGGRDKMTLFRFPTLNPAVLAKVYDRMMHAWDERITLQDKDGLEKTTLKPVPTKYEIQDAARTNIDHAEQLFLEKYAKEANFAQLYAYELSKYKEATLESRRSNEGIWVKYNQQQEGTQALRIEAEKLSLSLRNKGTMWCTEQPSFSESQLAGGDFYVYYTREDFDKPSNDVALKDLDDEEKKKVCTMPRIAIKMLNGKINELRGIVGGQEQDLEPEMIDIARTKCEEENLGGRAEYEKKAKDMKRLTSLVEKQEKGVQFTQDDLFFLYEVNETIESFGHNGDPRINKLLWKRNRQEDAAIVYPDMKHLSFLKEKCLAGEVLSRDDLLFIYEIQKDIDSGCFSDEKQEFILEIHRLRDMHDVRKDLAIIFSCEFSQVACDFADINESTFIFYDLDTGYYLDYRKEENKEKLQKHIEFAKKVKETGSPARPDMSLEGGFVTLAPPYEHIKDLSTALDVFGSVGVEDSSFYIVGMQLSDMPYTVPVPSFEALILLYGNDERTSQSSSAIVADMDKLGYRPATLSELISLGILKREVIKQSGNTFVGLGTKQLFDEDGEVYVPVLWSNSVGVGLWRNSWSEHDRFVCVRK